ncbi:MAG TPA: tetratricopeptide repeat protein [Stenomitos sp.]
MPTVSLCMIVKNEERYLEGCLLSARGVVDEIVVVDTGSTDGTLAIAERFGARVVHFPWTGDFAEARNVSLEHATSDWILVLDADERLEAASQHKLGPLLQRAEAAGYSLICQNLVGTGEGDESQRAPVFRLFRNRLGIRFEGMIHEQAIHTAKQTGLQTYASDLTLLHLGYAAEEVNRRDKRQRNLAILERQVEREPHNPFVHFNLGEVLKLLGCHADAECHYQEALRLLKATGASHGVSYYANLYFSLGDLYRDMGRYPEAHAILDEAIAHYPTFADLYYTKGFTYFAEARYHEAIDQFAQCPQFAGLSHPFAADPAIPGHKAFRALADCHIQLQDRTQAKGCLEEALRLHPNPDAALFTNLGILLLEEGQEDAALAYFEQAMAQDPKEIRCWLNFLQLSLQREAYPRITEAWSRRPDDPYCQALMVLAFALSDRAWPEERPADETLVLAWSEAIELAVASSRSEVAQALLDRLDELGAALLTLEFSLGQVFMRLNMPDLALGAFLRAQQRHPDHPRIYSALGDASLAAGNNEEARAMYARALELAPDAAYPRGRLHDLESYTSSGSAPLEILTKSPPRA